MNSILLLFLLSATSFATPLDTQVLYFILVDRFYNGNQTNDQNIDLSDAAEFHGGDLEGIKQKINYINDLGADTIWLSPIFSMRTEKFHGHGAFHGYWVTHLDSIEERFGGNKALLQLTEEMKENDMKLVMDMIYNHVSFDSPMVKAHPDWFGSYPSIADWNDPFQLTHYSVHGLPDLNQSRPPVYSYLYHRSIFWQQEADIAGYRIDAIRHLEQDFITKINSDLQNNTTLWLLGEDFQGNPNALIDRAQKSHLDALFDFPMYYAITESFCDQKGMAPVGSILSMDQYYPKGFQLVRFLDNHDVPRIISRCQEDPQKAIKALFFLFSIRGIPMITYGTEGWLSGEHEPENRKDMPWDDLSNLKNIQILSSLRTEYPVLRDGTGRIIEFNSEWMMYEQSIANQLSFYIHNSSDQDKSIVLPTYVEAVHKMFYVTDHVQELKEMVLPANSSALLLTSGKPQTQQKVSVKVHLNESDSQQYLLVGNHPEIGGWDPNKGIPFTTEESQLTAEVSIPNGTVLSFKVVKKENEQYIWEDGNNHILWAEKNKSITVQSRL